MESPVRKSNAAYFIFPFFRFERARPPCQCADVLNWLVILIEFHYTPGRQSLGVGPTNVGLNGRSRELARVRMHVRTHARTNGRRKRFTAVCRRDDSKNADNSTGIKQRRLLWKYFADRNNVSPAGFHVEIQPLIKNDFEHHDQDTDRRWCNRFDLPVDADTLALFARF